MGDVITWDVKGRKRGSKFRASDKFSGSVAFSPDCSMLAAGSLHGSIRVWNIETGSLVAQVPGALQFDIYFGAVNTLAFDQESRRLVSGSSNGTTVKMWDLPASTNSSFPAEKMEVRLILQGQKVRDTQYVPT